MRELKFKKIIIFAFIFMVLQHLRAKHSDYIGTPTSKLMEIEVDTRVNSLGGAYCGYVNDIVGYEENIAGISELKEKQFVIAYYDWLLETSIQYIAFGMPVHKKGVWVTSLKFLSIPPFPNKDDWGRETGVIDINNFVFSAGFARKYKYNIKYGVNLKYNYQNYSVDNNKLISFSSLGLDVGLQYKWDVIRIRNIPLLKRKKLYIRNLQIGFTFQNIGLSTSPDSIPRKFKIGVAYPFIKNCVFLFDINKNVYNFESIIDSDYRFNLGIEYNYKNIIYIRAGFKLGYDMNNFSIGAGFQTQLGAFLSMINYAYSEHKTLGAVNNFSFSTKFEELTFKTPLPLLKRRLAEYHYYRGISLFVQDEIEKAIAEWKEVLKIDPDNTDAIQRIKEAEEILEKRKKLHPQDYLESKR